MYLFYLIWSGIAQTIIWLSMFIFWVIMPRGHVGSYERFGETICLHTQGQNVGIHLQVTSCNLEDQHLHLRCCENPKYHVIWRSTDWTTGVRFFVIASTLVLGPTQPPVWLVPGAFLPWVNSQSAKLTTALHLVLRLLMRYALPTFLHMSSWHGD